MKQSTVVSENKYSIDNYDGDGIYLNTDEFQFQEIMLVCIEVYTIPISFMPIFELEDTKVEDEKPSENFILKLIAVSQGNVKQVEL